MGKIRIYSELSSATIFFEGSKVNPKELGSVEAINHGELTDRIIVKSTRLFKRGSDTERRVLFKKLNIDRIQDKDGNQLNGSTYNYDRDQIVTYLNGEFSKSIPLSAVGEYKGVYDASTNTPDFSATTPKNGDYYRVSVEGNDYIVNDEIWYSESSLSWQTNPFQGVKVDSIIDSALTQYDIHVDPNFTGSIKNGSSVYPYNDLETAINASSTGASILVKGINIIASEIILPHSLSIYGANDAEIKYASYDVSNGDIFSFTGSNTEKFDFENITYRNAGGYGLLLKKTEEINIRNCEFYNNGWDGTQLSTVASKDVSGLIGYDSTDTELQSFYAGVHASNGGAVRIEECRKPLIRESRAEGNLRGFRVQDSGINGGGFLIENQAIGNIESGIYIAAGELGGSQNITVAINYSAYNANNGLLCIGGINNKFSQNEVYGNWNAGLCAWGSANLTLRDCGLYDNNRSQYNGIGNTGDAKASIQINDAYSYLATDLQNNPNFRFIAEILDTQVHYTGLGSNTDKIGFLMTSGMGNIPDNDKNIIKIDDVGFIGQDYAIDLSEVDISNLRLSLGDNSYQSIGQKAVKSPLAGNYSELPFSNHVMQVPEVDVVVDTLKQTIALHEGVGGNVINTYSINELATDLKSNSLDIIQRSSDKIQLRDLTFGNIYVNGVVAGNNLNSANNTLIAALNMNLTQYTDFLKSDVFDYTDDSTSPPIVETNEVLADGTNYNSSYMTLGVPDGNGEATLIAQQNGDNKADVWSNIPINQMGEYSVFQTDSSGGGKRFYVGFTTDDQLSNLADGLGNGHEGIKWSVAIYDGYNTPWTFYGTQAQASYDSQWWGGAQAFRDHSGIMTGKVTWKVGIETDGKFYVYFWSLLDEEWKYVAKTNYTLVGDNYHPVVRFYTNGGGFYNGFDNFRYEETETQAEFYYIESPDGVFHYPLFKSAEEANLVDGVLGGSGTSHTHTYIDDLTNTVWHMPDTGSTMAGNSAPSNGTYTATNGASIDNITWNEQTTGDDSNYAPTFGDIVYTIQEGGSVNIQYKGQGDTNIYNLTNIPSGYADTGFSIVGTAETILDGVGIQHVINVTKVEPNGFGSDTGTITLNVTDDTTNNVSQNETPWTKALDFSGSNEHLQKVNTWTGSNPLLMDSVSQVLAAPNTVGNTANASNARPWATAIVFKYDGNNSNQHIWNSGEGAGSTDDNIYLRLDSSGNLYFGWGRQGALNECRITYLGTSVNTNYWQGVYIAHNGTRLSGANATSSNLADCFDIRLMNSIDSFSSLGSNRSTSTNWILGSIGGRMDRSFTGNFTIGGRGSNRSFHGKVASMIITTLKLGVAMPTDAEIELMITDPKKWEDDYRIGQTVRRSQGANNVSYANSSVYNGHGGTQIWLMGDGTSDSYANGIRNEVYPADQNYGKLQLNSMQSNDIQNINISGLS